MSKHGGSPVSGLVMPAGLEGGDKLAPGASMVLEPAVSAELRQREARKRNFERRRIALELLVGMSAGGVSADAMKTDVALALQYADELVEQTGGEL